MGSVVAEHRLSCSVACGTFLDQGLKPLFPALADRLLTIELPGKYISYESLAGSLVVNFSLLIYVGAHEDKLSVLQNAIVYLRFEKTQCLIYTYVFVILSIN